MNSLPTLSPYDFETRNNSQQAEALFKSLFPELSQKSISFETMISVMFALQDTGVNPEILPQVIRGIHAVRYGTGVGRVLVHISNDMVNVETRQQGDNLATLRNIE